MLVYYQHVSGISYLVGTLTNTYSVHDDPDPCLDPWAGSWILFWQWYLAVPNAVCTWYLILKSVMGWNLQTLSSNSKRRL